MAKTGDVVLKVVGVTGPDRASTKVGGQSVTLAHTIDTTVVLNTAAPIGAIAVQIDDATIGYLPLYAEQA